MKHDLSVVILAANAGRRMRSYGPISQVKINGMPIWMRQTYALKDAEIIVVAGYQAEKVKRAVQIPVKVVENKDWNFTNAAYSAKLGIQEATNDRILIIHGDMVFNHEAIIPVAESKSSCVLVDEQGCLRASEIGVTISQGEVTRLDYGLPKKWGQVVLLAGEELDLFRADLDLKSHSRFVWEIINAVIDRGGTFTPKPPAPSSVLAEIDTARDVKKASLLLKDFECVY